MAFILSTDGRDEDIGQSFVRYEEYLANVKELFPNSAYALATSDWYFNFNDHRCPHDSWLESCTLTEESSGKRSEVRSISLKLRMLNAIMMPF